MDQVVAEGQHQPFVLMGGQQLVEDEEDAIGTLYVDVQNDKAEAKRKGLALAKAKKEASDANRKASKSAAALHKKLGGELTCQI